jgi:tyrosine-protein phosphatase non-receptor type 23
MQPIAISMVLQQKCRKLLWFCRRDIYAGMVCTLADIRFEMVAILYNIGALHSQLGASDSRVTADGMKLSCTHFQCAAWAFQVFFFAAYSCILR